jgi:tripartite-type tricarboxylate transporter receptor subunit TctC
MISNLKVAVVGSIMVLPWSVALSSGAHADTFPSKVVRIVVPFAAGGTADITARKLGDVLSRKWGQPVIIENKAGASSMVGGLAVARAPADGYTILQSSDPLLSVSHLMAKRPQLNPFTDFTPITTLIRLPLAVAVGASEPVRNLQELAALAKTKPLNYGTFGPGTAPHLATELFMSLAGIDMTQISYRGTAPILLALTTGEIQVLVISPGSLLPTAQAGKARILAVDGQKRFYQTPDVPTFAEAGFAKMRAPSWWGYVAPANTPKSVVDKLNQDINEAMRQPEIVKFFQDSGFEPVGGTPADLAALMKDTEALWEPTIKRLGLQLE